MNGTVHLFCLFPCRVEQDFPRTVGCLLTGSRGRGGGRGGLILNKYGHREAHVNDNCVYSRYTDKDVSYRAQFDNFFHR